MHGYKHLTCKPEDLPDLLETYQMSGYTVTSCYYDTEDQQLHLVVVK